MEETFEIGPLFLTKRALSQFSKELNKEETAPQAIRVGVRGGGCKGYQYLLDFIHDLEEETDKDEDTLYIQNNVTFVIDVFSEEYLKGVTLDYETSLAHSGFKFVGGNRSKSCGCGSSFSV